MSNKAQQAKEHKLDSEIVMVKGRPIAILPISDRCKGLFLRWGMEADCDGIAPPDSPMDLISSMPGNWLCGVRQVEEGDVFVLQEITLPQPLMVLH